MGQFLVELSMAGMLCWHLHSAWTEVDLHCTVVRFSAFFLHFGVKTLFYA